MPPELIPSDEDYASSEDSDFAPDAVPAANEDDSSDDEADIDELAIDTKAQPKANKKRKRGDNDEEAEDVGYENSGDEEIIGEGVKERKKAKKRKGKKSREELEDEGGEGGLIKTRSMRAQEEVKKKPLADTSAATVDVDALWSQMISGNASPAPPPKPTIEKGLLNPDVGRGTTSLTEQQTNGRNDSRSPSTTLSDGPDSMIMIKRTYNFAGKSHTEQKLVPKNSAEARLYLASLSSEKSPATEAPPSTESSPFIKPKRPLKKIRRSVFEPIVEGLPQRTDLHFGVRKDTGVTLLGDLGAGKEKKLNTVEKSAMDWAGFVDKEGIKDELDAAGKSKGAYRARQEFLARVEMNKLEEERRLRGLS